MAANSIINAISSFASLSGPVLGGIVYSIYGLGPVLYICIICFILSAVMELFIKIPFVKRETGIGIWHIIKQDFTESIKFIRKEKPVIGKELVVICGINLFLSSMIVVALPYMITEVLSFDTVLAKRLCGIAEGALAAGGLAGGILAGIFAKKLDIKSSGNLIIICALCVFPMGIILIFELPGIVNYIVIAVCCFIIMVFSTVFTIQMMSFVQSETPQDMLGKVISVIFTVSMCAQPAGNAMYGILFEICKDYEFIVILFAGMVSLIIAVCAKNIFRKFL